MERKTTRVLVNGKPIDVNPRFTKSQAAQHALAIAYFVPESHVKALMFVEYSEIGAEYVAFINNRKVTATVMKEKQ